MSNIVSHGLIGTHPVVVTFKRDSDAPFIFTMGGQNKYQNQYVTIPYDLPGLWNINVVLNGKPDTTWSYQQMTLTAAITTDNVVETSSTDYAVFAIGTYYQNESTGEIFIVSDKNYDAVNAKYYLTLNRGMFGTSAKAMAVGNIIDRMNTVIMNSATTTGTAGKITLAAATSAMANGDKFILTINDVTKTYKMVTTPEYDDEIAVASTLAAQATNIANKLSGDWADFKVSNSSNNVVMDQKVGSPITLALTSVIAGTGTFTGTITTQGVSPAYNSGFGQIFFTPMPQPGFGQKYVSNE